MPASLTEWTRAWYACPADSPVMVCACEVRYDVASVVEELLDSLVTTAPMKNREREAAKARARAAARFSV